MQLLRRWMCLFSSVPFIHTLRPLFVSNCCPIILHAFAFLFHFTRYKVSEPVNVIGPELKILWDNEIFAATSTSVYKLINALDTNESLRIMHVDVCTFNVNQH